MKGVSEKRKLVVPALMVFPRVIMRSREWWRSYDRIKNNIIERY